MAEATYTPRPIERCRIGATFFNFTDRMYHRFCGYRTRDDGTAEGLIAMGSSPFEMYMNANLANYVVVSEAWALDAFAPSLDSQ